MAPAQQFVDFQQERREDGSSGLLPDQTSIIDEFSPNLSAAGRRARPNKAPLLLFDLTSHSL
jgi:hypothetical protein